MNRSYRATTTVRRVFSELDMLLRVNMDHEGRRVDNLLTNTDVSLLNELTSVVNGLGKTELEDLSLQSAVHELRGGKFENVIELHVFLRDETEAGHTADNSSTLEDSAGVLLVQSEEFTSSLHFTQNTEFIPYGSWQGRVELSRFHACSEDRIHRKYGVLGPNVHVHKDDGEYRR